MMLRMQLLLGMEPGKIAKAHAMLTEFDEEEAALLNKINQANWDFLINIGGHVIQLQPVSLGPAQSSTPIVPPGISDTVCVDSLRVSSDRLAHSKKSDDKWCIFARDIVFQMMILMK